VKADSFDAAERWQEIVDDYAEFAATTRSNDYASMIALAEWVRDQPMASLLYPGISLDWLTVSLTPGYHADRPFFKCGIRADGRFEFELRGADGESRMKETLSPSQASDAFARFAEELKRIA
jgi:hypothetical protein